jgi:hypothetical protein
MIRLAGANPRAGWIRNEPSRAFPGLGFRRPRLQENFVFRRSPSKESRLLSRLATALAGADDPVSVQFSRNRVPASGNGADADSFTFRNQQKT